MMHRTAAQNRLAPLLFLSSAGAVYAAALAVAHVLPTLDRAGAVAFGLTIDLVAVVPLLFYWLVVRRRGWPLVSVVPVLVLSVLAARQILPLDHQQALRLIELLAVPAEIGLLGWIALRAARALRSARRGGPTDPVDRLRHAAFDLARHDRVADILATEIALLYYALGSWRARPHVPEGTAAFTHHRRGGHGGIVFAFLIVLFMEGVAAHLLLSLWSVLAAWIFSAGTIYGALWLIADYRATVLRPILVGGESVSIRAGLRFRLDLPRERIAAVLDHKPDLGRECASLTLLAAPTRWIVLSESMLARGPYGLGRRVRAVGIAADDPDGLARALGASAGA